MTGERSFSQEVIIVRVPAKLKEQRTQNQRRISHPPSNHHISPLLQSLGDPLGAQVGIGGNEKRLQRLQLLSGLENGEGKIALNLREDVIPQHCRQFQGGEPQRKREVFDHLHRGHGIGRSHIGNDLDLLFCAQRQDSTHPIGQPLVISLLRMPGLLLLSQGDGPFRQAFKDNVLNSSLFHHCHSRFDTISAIPCPGAYADRSHCFSPSLLLLS